MAVWWWRWKPITGTISLHIGFFTFVIYHLRLPLKLISHTDRKKHTNTHDRRMRSEFEHPLCPLNILCENPTTTAAKEVVSVRKDTGVSGDVSTPQRDELNEKEMTQILQSILIEFRFNATSSPLPYASWELKSAWQTLEWHPFISTWGAQPADRVRRPVWKSQC